MKYGLIGEHLNHSFSKEIHERLASYTYDLMPLNQEEFKNFMIQKDFCAINVTIPYKKSVIPYLDEMDKHALEIGAVNTIVNTNGILKGFNTDFTGFLYTLQKHNICVAQKKVLVLGNGGASAAIQAVLKAEQANQIIIVNRTQKDGAITYEEVFERHLDAQFIINTSPIGMFPNNENSPIDLSMFKQCESVVDIIYNPLKTALCVQAEMLKIKHVNGLEMLIGQAKQAVEYFLNEKLDDSLIDDIYLDMLKKRCNLILIGMPSAGKTSIGRQLGKHLHKDFIDLDEAIIIKAGMKIPQIFETLGEEGFRKLEYDVTKEVAKLNNKVIASGGGIVKNQQNITNLKQNGNIYFIDRDMSKLINDDPNRPLSSSQEALHIMYKERYPLYKACADFIIPNNEDMESAIDTILTNYMTSLNKNESGGK
ncbi:MAG: shikimate kinase [Longicatena sp.]